MGRHTCQARKVFIAREFEIANLRKLHCTQFNCVISAANKFFVSLHLPSQPKDESETFMSKDNVNTGANASPSRRNLLVGSAAIVAFAGQAGPGLCQFNFVVPRGVTGGTDLRVSTSPTRYTLWVSP